MRPAAHPPVPVTRGRPGETRPASIVGPFARRIFTVGSVLFLVGAVLSLSVPVFDLQSNACGPIGCGLLQVLGKALAAGGLGVGLAAIAVATLRAGHFSAGVLAALIAAPALLWAVMIVDDWQRLQSGTDEAGQILAVARDYTASQRSLPPDQVRGLIVNGRGAWVSVREAEPGTTELVVLEKTSAGWQPRAIAPSFTKEQLRDLGAPTDVTESEV